ncbi:MAG: type secretion system rane protein PorP/SprF [Ferruginibacter sp.]|nr:type secretion system rane protein PorP/SprF [Ferruginibacter sp.]
MKKFLLHFILCLCLYVHVLPASAQDIHFSQIFETPLLRNPGLAGLFSGDVRVQSVYRSQWNSITDAYKTVSLNAEYKIPVGQGDDFVTLGGQVLYDKAGTVALTSTHILPVLNYHKSLGADKSKYISMGLMGGYVQRSIDRSKMTTNSQFDGSGYNEGLSNGEAMANGSYGYFDGSAGISFNSQIGENPDNNFFVGAAYHHFNKPKKISFYSDNKLEMAPKWVGSAGVRMGITESSYFTIEADYSQQGNYTETTAGVLYSWKLDDVENPKYLFHAGAYLRLKDAMIPVAKIEFKPLAVAVSYDANISPLKVGSKGRGGFELSVIYQKYLDRYNSSRDAVRCPKF